MGLPGLRELKPPALWSCPGWCEALVDELPRLERLHLVNVGLETLSAAAFQSPGRLQVLVLGWETGLVLNGGF